LLDRKIVHVSDVLADPEYTYGTGQKIGGYRTVLGVPLMREGTPIGVMAMNRLGVRPLLRQAHRAAYHLRRSGSDCD